MPDPPDLTAIASRCNGEMTNGMRRADFGTEPDV